jgi:hypothetical protein
MGEARRKAKAIGQMEESLRQAHAEGQGVWSIEAYHCGMIPEILLGAACGDEASARLAAVVKSVVAGIHRPTLGKGKPTQCLTCDTAFTPAANHRKRLASSAAPTQTPGT